MRVLYVIDSLVPGGAERSLVALAPWYAAKGIELDVAFLHDRIGLQHELQAAEVTLFCLAGPGGRIGWTRRAASLVRQRRPDLIHTTLFEADVAGRVAAALGRRPVVSSLVNVAYGPEMLSDPTLRKWKVRGAQIADGATARIVRRFHALTHHVADVMADRLRIPRDRIDVVPRGRDPVQLGTRTPERRSRIRTELEVDDHVPLLLAVARQERQKGLDVLLEALPEILSQVPAARLVVAGRAGSQTASLQATVNRRRLQESVRFLGARADVAELLCGADLFVFPSRWEGLGGAVLEAMALEVPIVVSDLPTVREVVGGEKAAWLIQPDRSDELARAVLAALNDPHETRRRAAVAAERFRARFTIEVVADAMVAFYDRALNRL